MATTFSKILQIKVRDKSAIIEVSFFFGVMAADLKAIGTIQGGKEEFIMSSREERLNMKYMDDNIYILYMW